MRALACVAVAVAVVGCGSKPDAATVCKNLEQAGIGARCHEEKPGGLNARAKQRFDFDLVNVPGQKGAVLTFEKADDFEATQKAYEAAAVLVGTHRYGNASQLVFVQLNSNASLEDGRRVKALVEGTPVPPASPATATATATTIAAVDSAAPPADRVVVKAQEYWDDYHANEVKADEKYKGKTIRVVGQIQSIDKDALGNMVVQFKSSNPLMPVTARMLESEKAQVAELKKEGVVGVQCKSGGMIIGRPTLQDCTILTKR